MNKLFALGLIVLLIAQISFSVPADTINLKEPIDFIHWALLIGIVLMIPYSLTFSHGLYHRIGAPITFVGLVCNIGMCTVDFVIWTYRDNADEWNAFVEHLMDEPAVWQVFITVGPPLIFVGLAIQAMGYLKDHAIASISAFIGSLIIGVGGLVFTDYRIIFIAGYVIFVAALVYLAFKDNRGPHSSAVST